MSRLMGMPDNALNLLFTLYFLGMVVQSLLLYFIHIGDASARTSATNTGDQGDESARTSATNPESPGREAIGFAAKTVALGFDGMLLLYQFWVAWYVAILKDNLFNGVPTLPGPDLRPALLSVILLGLWLTIRRRSLRAGLCVPLLLGQMLCPGNGTVFGMCMTLTGTALILLRLAELSVRMGKARTCITRRSVKEALDCLPDGLMYAGPSGHPLSVNLRAQTVMHALGLSAYERMDILWEKLSRHSERIMEVDRPDTLLLRSREGTCFSFLKLPVEIGHKRFTQIHMRDVSAEYAIALQIREENEHLATVAKELKEFLALVEDNAKRQALLDARARLHDILSQRLSLTHVLLSGFGKMAGEQPLGEIRHLLMRIGQDLFYEPSIPARDMLDELIRTYHTIGVGISVEGPWPASEEIADVFVKILREAFSNALRHAGATHVRVQFGQKTDGHRMTVVNDGTCPSASPPEGNGLAGMRARLAPLGGTLTIETGQTFTLHVHVGRSGISSG